MLKQAVSRQISILEELQAKPVLQHFYEYFIKSVQRLKTKPLLHLVLILTGLKHLS